ncbi:AAA family ATPase [Kitasatospora purpeofusca]|uniref:AAA family ATPase n=1 Tax=Kitasatospora purpeofusca TaxID=67352 RepID=UPI0022528DE2|nr:SMC family ATPase [Kitasatospora purpeofusca]MCX4756759.1 SMC family ATPase [Kitasatospora purpeofusca]WSR35456.1 SMC family ATPase [Kitasatospora purpeofusca]
MRLHRLTVTAFGPFAGAETVDFDALAAGGLFLLRGATGAGKSSVLDAVCYALYGEVPGTRRANRLRSDHAEPDRLTEVRLELTLGGRRLEIVRIPEQPRPKKVGTGMTVERAQTLLREWSADGAGTGADGPGWRAVSKSHQEAGEEIHRLIGMSRDQFCQVVLLPQGDFARFLRADSEERGKLLRRLFDTERFQSVEAWLAEQRRAHETAVQTGRRRLRDLASKAEQAAGPGAEPAEGPVAAEDEAAPSATADAGLTTGVLGWAAVLRGGAAERLTVAEAALAGAEEAHRAAQRAREAAEQRADRQERHRQAVREAARLAEDEPARAADRRRLTAAQAAVGVESVLHLRERAAAAYRQAREEEHRHRAVLAEVATGRTGRELLGGGDRPGSGDGGDSGERGDGPVGTGRALAHAEAEELAAAERRLREEIVRLEAAGADERQCAELARARTSLTSDLRRAEDLAEEAGEWLADFDARHTALKEEESAAREAAALVERLDAKRADLTLRLSAARARDALDGEVGRAGPRALALRAEALDARQYGLDLRERRLAGMAAELASGLSTGEPCRVCGSAEHPAPARPVGEPVRAEDEERARRAQTAAEQAADAAEQELAGLRVRRAAAAGAAGEEAADALAGMLGGLATEHREAVRVAERLGAVGRAVERLTEEQSARRTALSDARERSAELAAQARALHAEQDKLTARVAAARGDAPSVAARAAALDRLASAVAALAGAARAATEAAHQLKQADDELAGAAVAAGFASAQDAVAVLLPQAERDALEQRIDRHRAGLAAVERRLAEPELVAAAALPPADLPGTRSGLGAATDRLRSAHAARDAARLRCESLAAIGRQLAELARSLAPELARYARISRLAALAAGTSTDNRLRMRLESYVLAARLEQVAAAASDRLVRMSGGRYTLVHSDDRGGGNKRSGLALRVVDAWTGTERDTATLSGGESFFASLALALGLADVVTDEAGGMPLDTLFIDEGFGSLDEHTLEEVMDVLDGLRERDRAVGIVSHVADLRSRIPAQLMVRKGRHGSTLAPAGREDA